MKKRTKKSAANVNLRVKKIEVKNSDKNGATSLYDAVRNNRIEEVKRLVKAGAKVNTEGNGGLKTPLHVALLNNNVDVLRILLGAGAYVDDRNHNQSTPLHVAARHGNTEAIRLLLKHGANVNARNNDGWTPLHCAEDSGKAESIQILLDAGADANRKAQGMMPIDVSSNSCRKILEEAMRTTKTVSPHTKVETLPALKDALIATESVIDRLIGTIGNVSGSEEKFLPALRHAKELRQEMETLIRDF